MPRKYRHGKENIGRIYSLIGHCAIKIAS
uniref:Uncharacterized protein n=1 Tax=Anguilla anguilla TaxID=7936 RepID=A0A0E9PMI4_ANGAN